MHRFSRRELKQPHLSTLAITYKLARVLGCSASAPRHSMYNIAITLKSPREEDSCEREGDTPAGSGHITNALLSSPQESPPEATGGRESILYLNELKLCTADISTAKR